MVRVGHAEDLGKFFHRAWDGEKFCRTLNFDFKLFPALFDNSHCHACGITINVK